MRLKLAIIWVGSRTDNGVILIIAVWMVCIGRAAAVVYPSHKVSLLMLDTEGGYAESAYSNIREVLWPIM